MHEEWREIGPVALEYKESLWERFKAASTIINRRHQEHFEAIKAEQVNNFERKSALCEEVEKMIAEAPASHKGWNKASERLQAIQAEWRTIGYAPKKDNNKVYDRFRAACDGFFNTKHAFYAEAKDDMAKNLEIKTALCERAEAIAEREDWAKATEELLALQAEWKNSGAVSRKYADSIWKRFRSACDKFFELKRSFYEGIKTEMEHNLQLKLEICEAAEAIKDSEQWKKSADELIELQKRWKEIGAVSRRHSDAVWKRFRAACDHFFARKSAHFADVDAEHSDNLAKKNALLEEIEKFDISGGSIEDIKEFQRRWSEIGFVPIKEKDALQKRYRAAIDRLFAVLRGGDRERRTENFRNKLSSMKGNGGKLRSERDRLYNKVKQLETDIATLENNIGFFARSKGAEALIRDVENKIARAKQEMADTIEKINLIDREQE